MIYESLNYVAAPGAADRLHERFAAHTLGIFARHGIEVEGFWFDVEDPSQIVYLIRFADEAARAAAWSAFNADLEWQQVKLQSEVDGPLVIDRSSRVLTAPAYAVRKRDDT